MMNVDDREVSEAHDGARVEFAHDVEMGGSDGMWVIPAGATGTTKVIRRTKEFGVVLDGPVAYRIPGLQETFHFVFANPRDLRLIEPSGSGGVDEVGACVLVKK